MRTSRRRRRLASALLAGVQFLALGVPALEAANFPSGVSRDEYVSDVQMRASLREDLERNYAEARFRRQQVDATIERIRQEEPPEDADLNEWYSQRSARIRWLDDYVRRNEEALTRYQTSLGTVYERLEEDRRFVRESQDQGLQQALGSLVGIAGIAGIPLAARPALSGMRSGVRVVQRGTVAGGGRINPRATPAPAASTTAAPAASSNAAAAGRGSAASAGAGTSTAGTAGARPGAPTSTSGAAGARPGAPTSSATASTQGAAASGQGSATAGRGSATASTQAGAADRGTATASTQGTAGATPRGSGAATTQGTAGAGRSSTTLQNGWRTDIGRNGNIQLRRGDRVVDLGERASTQQGRGRNATQVRNDAAWSRAEGLQTMYGARDTLSTSIRDLRSQLRTAPREGRASIRAEIKNLEAQQKALNQDIKQAERPTNQGGGVRSLAASAAKWALFSTGLTIGMRAFDQLRENDWDVSSIDWGDAVAPLRTAEFWGGTAGSFGLSMAASAIIPGGAFIRTLGAIGGAAVGWQLGSGNLQDTDWAELGASTLGATLGSLLGSALGGPIGAFIGGLAGHFLATWLLGKVRDWLEDGAIAFSPEDREIIDKDGDLTPYAGGVGPPRGGGDGDVVAIRRRMNQIYSQIDALMKNPRAGPQGKVELTRLHSEYDQLFEQLEAARHNPSSQGGGQRMASASGVGSWTSP